MTVKKIKKDISNSVEMESVRPGGQVIDQANIDAEKLQKAAKSLNLDLAGGSEAQLGFAVEKSAAMRVLASKACELAVEVGLHLLAARSDFKHGEWIPFLESNGFTRQSASELMLLGARWTDLSPEARKQLTSAGPSKAYRLVSLDSETLESAHEHGDLSKYVGLSKRELVAEIKRLKQEAESRKSDLRQLRQSADNAKAASADSVVRLQMPDFVINARHESNVVGEQLVLGLDHLTDVFRRQLLQNAEGASLRLCEQAAGTMYHVVTAVFGRAKALLDEISSAFPESSEAITTNFQLTAAEIERSSRALEIIRQRHGAQIKNRDTERKLAKKRDTGGAGRKPGFVDEE